MSVHNPTTLSRLPSPFLLFYAEGSIPYILCVYVMLYVYTLCMCSFAHCSFKWIKSPRNHSISVHKDFFHSCLLLHGTPLWVSTKDFSILYVWTLRGVQCLCDYKYYLSIFVFCIVFVKQEYNNITNIIIYIYKWINIYLYFHIDGSISG